MRAGENHEIIAEALVDALIDEPFYLAITVDLPPLSPDTQKAGTGTQTTEVVTTKKAGTGRRAKLVRYFEYSMEEGERLGALVVPQADTFGAAVWLFPNSPEVLQKSEREKKAFLEVLLGKRGFENYKSIIAFMSSKAEEAVPEDSWYLSILGVSPKRQGRGLGGALIRPTLAKADKMGVPCYVETFSPRSVGFYKKFGFAEVASHVEPITKCRYWIMLREPRSF